MASFIGWLLGYSNDYYALPSTDNQLLASAGSADRGGDRKLLLFDIIDDENEGKWSFRLLIQGDACGLKEIADSIADAAKERLRQLNQRHGRPHYKSIPRQLHSDPLNPFELADRVRREEGYEYLAVEYHFFDAFKLIPRERLLDLRPLQVGQGTNILCPSQTLRDYTRWGEDCLLNIKGEEVAWTSPSDPLLSLTDVHSDQLQSAPEWLKKAHLLIGENTTLLTSMLSFSNQMIMNNMVYQIQNEFQLKWNVSVFPDGGSMCRFIQVVSDGDFQKLIISVNGRMNHALAGGSRGFITMCEPFECFGTYSGISIINLNAGSAKVRTRIKFFPEIFQKYANRES